MKQGVVRIKVHSEIFYLFVVCELQTTESFWNGQRVADEQDVFSHLVR